VLVADDQPVIVNGFTLMIDAESDMEVVGTAADGISAVERSAELRPDVVLMDIRMPGIDGIEATRRIVDAATAGAVLIITTFDDEDLVVASARAGASGFLLKNARPDLLAAAVRSASTGDALIDPGMTRGLLARSVQRSSPDRIGNGYRDALAALTDREREVLTLLAQGLSNSDIGRALFLGEATIKTHLANIFGKANVRTRVAAVMFAYESGFVTPRWAEH